METDEMAALSYDEKIGLLRKYVLDMCDAANIMDFGREEMMLIIEEISKAYYEWYIKSRK